MQDWESMSQVRWECKYPVVFIPKYRHKVLYGRVREAGLDLFCGICADREEWIWSKGKRLLTTSTCV
jgi:putative transposase